MIIRQIEWKDPVAAFSPFARETDAILLDSGAAATGARWSFLCVRPSATIRRRDGQTFVDGAATGISPFDALKRLHEDRRRLDYGTLPPLCSGLVGIVGYECGALLEPSAAGPAAVGQAPDFSFGAYDCIVCFDRGERRAFITTRHAKAAEEIEASLGNISPSGDLERVHFVDSTFSAEQYRRVIKEVIERIRSGAVYQANISHRLRFKSDESINAFPLFSRALESSGAANAAFINTGRAQIVSLSPERFFSVSTDVSGRRICAEPIKGTRPRGRSPDEDARLAKALVTSAKDRAENIMIADLTRNDLSRLCDDGSIREDAICELMTLATVHHLVSKISGRLRDSLSAADALATLFPCGSITGAPKIEAMRTIAELEPVGRGPYCGAIGYIDDRGGADFSVAIRTAIVEGQMMTAPVGGGVTLRSDPEAEYQETLDKAEWLFRATGFERSSLS